MENTDNSGVDGNNSRVTYSYPMVKETDMTESMKADVSLAKIYYIYKYIKYYIIS